MRRMRALLSYSIAAAMLAGTAACSVETEDSSQIDVWIGFTDYRLDWAKEKAKAFEEAHSDYTVNVKGYDSYEVLFDKVVAASEQGETPTIVQNFEAATQESRDAVTPEGDPLFTSVEDAIDGRSEILGEKVVLDDVVDSARNYYTIDGEFSSMPWNTSTPIFYSNKQIMDRAGIDEAPATWEDLAEACDKVMALDDAPKNCVSWPNQAWFPEQVLAEQNAMLADNENGRDGRAENIDLTSDEWDRQRRAEHQQCVRVVDEPIATLHLLPGHVLPEEHDIGFQYAGAACVAGDDVEVVHEFVGDVNVSVGVVLDAFDMEPRVRGVHPRVQRRPGSAVAAVEADHPAETAVKLDNAIYIGGVMQAIHVLGDHAVHEPAGVQCRYGLVPSVRGCLRNRAPTEMAAGPIPAPVVRTGHEILIRHGGVFTQPAIRAAVVGDPGLRRQAGAAEDKHPTGRDSGHDIGDVRRDRGGRARR